MIKMTHKYKVKYNIDPEVGEFSAEEIRKEGYGATDAFIFFSLIFYEDGIYSQNFFSFDGRNKGKSLSSNDLWKVWALLTKNLIERKEELHDTKYFIVKTTFEMIKELFK